MKNHIVSSVVAALVILCCAKAQWTPDPFCPYPSDHVTRYPYYGNCSVFWECYEGTKYVMECPEGLEFNAPLQQCDTPSIANCDPYASTTFNPNHTRPTGSTPSTTTLGPYPVCPLNDTLIYFPFIGDCSKYWECFGGNRYLYNCPAGLWWHQAISECDYPGDYCDNSTTQWTEPTYTPTFSTPTTSGNDPRCSEGGTSYWPQPGECHRYIECLDGISYLVTCPPNLFFSDRVKQCVRVDESECCEVYECQPGI